MGFTAIDRGIRMEGLGLAQLGLARPRFLGLFFHMEKPWESHGL